MLFRLKLYESSDFISLLFQAPTKVIYDNQQVIVVDNIMMIDARYSGILWRTNKRTRKILAWNIPEGPFQEQKGGGDMEEDCFSYPKISLVKSPILDQRELFITWFMLLLKYWLHDIIFKLVFFKISFSSFPWTIINVNKLTHKLYNWIIVHNHVWKLDQEI